MLKVDFFKCLLGIETIFTCRTNLETQLEDLCTKSAQSSLHLQNLLKQLTLFRRHIEEVKKVQDGEDLRTRVSLNKDELDKSNVQRKWYIQILNNITNFYLLIL